MQFLAVVLYPFSVLYDLITRFRNHLYNTGYKRSFSFEINTIAVGNLSVGGTGKTPMVEYIIRLLSKENRITTLSRGYGRKSKGFILASDADTAESIGDEPYQIFKKYDEVNVAVCEDRALAIPFILTEKPDTNVILLDDAYQHRSVKPHVNILLTDFNKPFFSDFVLPSGRLRESRSGAHRADIIVLTKCPDALSEAAQQQIMERVRTYNSHAEICFSGIRYGQPKPFGSSQSMNSEIVAFSGIARAKPFVDHLETNYNLERHLDFKDHHNYSLADVKKLASIANSNKSLVTTEKDMVKLIKPDFTELISDMSIFYMPIETYFIKGGRRFDEIVQKSIRQYSY